jgi:O-antigen biosynthesis protein
MSHVVCVTGMHRSGTSLTASWLQKCGLLIDVGGLIGPAAGNRLGHFEDLEMVRLQSEEIQHQLPRSQGWKVTNADYLSFTDQRAHLARELVEVRGSSFDQWGWKDPRSLLFLPSWQRLVPRLTTLIVWRPAPAVVDSLARRSRRRGSAGMRVGRLTAWRTWTAYNQLACRFKREHPDRVLLVPLARVTSSNSAVLEILRGKLELDLRPVPIDSVFNPSLLADDSSDLWHAELRPWHRVAATTAKAVQDELAELSDL